MSELKRGRGRPPREPRTVRARLFRDLVERHAHLTHARLAAQAGMLPSVLSRALASPRPTRRTLERLQRVLEVHGESVSLRRLRG